MMFTLFMLINILLFYYFNESFVLLLYVIMILSTMLMSISKSKFELLMGYSIIMMFLMFIIVESWFWLFIMFESISLPMIMIVLLFSYSPEKIVSVYVMSLYMMLSGLLLMLMVVQNIHLYDNIKYDDVVWSLMFMCFLIKVPLIGLHLWLTLVHVESSSLGSIILSSLLLKLGLFGCSMMLIYANNDVFIDFIKIMTLLGFMLSVVSSLMQTDIKKIIALFSVSHMNLVLFSLLMMNGFMDSSSFGMMMTHSISSSMLFGFVGLWFNNSSSRMVYWWSNQNSSNVVMFIMMMTWLINISIPLSLSLLFEIGLMNVVNMMSLWVSLLLVVGFIVSGWQSCSTMIYNMFVKSNTYYMLSFMETLCMMLLLLTSFNLLVLDLIL